MASWFATCFNLRSVEGMDTYLDTAHLTRTAGLFYNCSNLEQIDLACFSNAQLINTAGMFSGCSKLTELDLSDFNMSQVTDMKLMFNGCDKLSTVKLGPKFQFKENPDNNTYVTLPAPPSGSPYNGKWAKQGTTQGYTPSDLATAFNADSTNMAGTWVWQNASATSPATYAVSYDANGGTGAPAAQTKTHDTALTLSSETPSKAYAVTYDAAGGTVSPEGTTLNCTFSGWNTDKNGSGTAYAAGASYTANAAATLFAQWSDPAMGTLPTPTRSGYNFAGWFTAASGGNAVSATSVVAQDTTVYAHWTAVVVANPYNLKDETYSFENYVDFDSWGGHCFGMSMTSSGYYNKNLDISALGSGANASLYSFSLTDAVKKPICYYQARQGSLSSGATVAGGSMYLTGVNDIASDWPAVVNYVKDHSYDGTGALQIGFRKGNGGHAINFLRYENVSGQDRIYAYDNNYPEEETYFYQDSNGQVYQTPKQSFNGSIDCIALRDVNKYFQLAKGFDSTHALYMQKDAAVVQGYSYSHMDTDSRVAGEYVMYEIPANVQTVTIVPKADDAKFVYMEHEYSFGNVTADSRGEFKFSSLDENAASTNETFKVYSSKDISRAKFTNPTAPYNAVSNRQPRPTVTLDGQTLVSGVHYTITGYQFDAKTGVGGMFIQGIAPYTGTAYSSFKATIPASSSSSSTPKTQVMYRVYNPYSGEHLYTYDTREYSYLGSIGWKQEKIAWTAPAYSSQAVYRVYNPFNGDHHYTTSASERNYLVRIGWKDEKVGWYSDTAKTRAVYRLFNPYLQAGSHHYTTSVSERNYLKSIGWKDEGIGWYGVK